MKKDKAVLFIYGSGGHKEQMKRFYATINTELKDNKYASIGFSEEGYKLSIFDLDYSFKPFRDKVSNLKTMFLLPLTLIKLIVTTFRVLLMFRCKVLISTGPGLVLIPSILFRILGKRVIFIETWSRFYTKSATGKIMYKISNDFYIQNKELETLYKRAKYVGRL